MRRLQLQWSTLADRGGPALEGKGDRGREEEVVVVVGGDELKRDLSDQLAPCS